MLHRFRQATTSQSHSLTTVTLDSSFYGTFQLSFPACTSLLWDKHATSIELELASTAFSTPTPLRCDEHFDLVTKMQAGTPTLKTSCFMLNKTDQWSIFFQTVFVIFL